MPDTPSDMTILRVADLPQRRPTSFCLRPSVDALTRIAEDLKVSEIRKLVFEGSIRAEGKRDWRLEAKLGATVVQPCIVTLDPVTTRIDAPVTRLYVAGTAPLTPEAEESEMPEDDTIEPLTPEIDLTRVMIEALALALPDYPRSEHAETGQTSFAPPGAEPLGDAEIKPFAGLAGLRDKLDKPH